MHGRGRHSGRGGGGGGGDGGRGGKKARARAKQAPAATTSAAQPGSAGGGLPPPPAAASSASTSSSTGGGVATSGAGTKLRSVPGRKPLATAATAVTLAKKKKNPKVVLLNKKAAAKAGGDTSVAKATVTSAATALMKKKAMKARVAADGGAPVAVAAGAVAAVGAPMKAKKTTTAKLKATAATAEVVKKRVSPKKLQKSGLLQKVLQAKLAKEKALAKAVADNGATATAARSLVFDAPVEPEVKEAPAPATSGEKAETKETTTAAAVESKATAPMPTATTAAASNCVVPKIELHPAEATFSPAPLKAVTSTAPSPVPVLKVEKAATVMEIAPPASLASPAPAAAQTVKAVPGVGGKPVAQLQPATSTAVVKGATASAPAVTVMNRVMENVAPTANHEKVANDSHGSPQPNDQTPQSLVVVSSGSNTTKDVPKPSERAVPKTKQTAPVTEKSIGVKVEPVSMVEPTQVAPVARSIQVAAAVSTATTPARLTKADDGGKKGSSHSEPIAAKEQTRNTESVTEDTVSASQPQLEDRPNALQQKAVPYWMAVFGPPEPPSPPSPPQRSAPVALKNAWGPSFGTTHVRPLPPRRVTPLSSWFLSNGPANFIKQVSFPSGSRRSRKSRRTTGSASSVVVGGEESPENKSNEFIASLGRGSWRSWYGKVDTTSAFDPPLKNLPHDVEQGLSATDLISTVASPPHTPTIQDLQRGHKRKRSDQVHIERFEIELKQERKRAKAFEDELLAMLQGKTLSGKNLEEEYAHLFRKSTPA